MHYHAALMLDAIQQIDAVSDTAQRLEDRPVEFSTLYRLFCTEPPEVAERRYAPETPTPASTQHDTLLAKVLPLLEQNGSLHIVQKHKFVDKPGAIQRALIQQHDLIVPIPVITQAQELKRSRAA